MTRRTIDLGPIQGQLDLSIPRRRRIQVLDEMDAQLAVDDSFVWAGIHLTGWSRAQPPCTGFWDTKQHSARISSIAFRMWYNLPSNSWCNPAPYQTSEQGRQQRNIPHDEFMRSHEWRGLLVAWPDGYKYDLLGEGYVAPGSSPLSVMKTVDFIIAGAMAAPARRRVEV